MGHAPAHSVEFIGRAHAHNRAGNGMRGRNRNARRGRYKKRNRAARFCTKPSNGFQFGNFLAHHFYNPPAPEKRARADGRVARNNDPRRRQFVRLAGYARSDQDHPNNTHCFLGIVPAVAQAVERSGN